MTCLSHSVGPCILDFGASNHIVDNPSYFVQISPLKTPNHITLDDGVNAEAIGIGQTTSLSSLSLKSIIFIPDCPFNLISVSLLIPSLNCSTTFTSNSFSIQG